MSSRKVLGSTIQQRRKAAQITQVEMAELLGIDQTSISAYETGTTALTLERAAEIAELLDLEWSVFDPRLAVAA